MATKKNTRCPLQQECEKKCEFEGHELECSYYSANAIEGKTIPDQEEIRRRNEAEKDLADYEAELDAIELDDDSENTHPAKETGGIVWIDIAQLHPHPDNPRKDLGDLQELSDSIKAKGVLQNLTVVRSENGYTVIIGHRRTEAARMAGLTKLPCIITEMTPAEQVQTMLLENMQRNDLTVYEQAQGFQMMLDFGDSIDGISEKTGFSKTTVRRRLKMAELNPEMLKKVSTRQVSLFDFDKLSQIEDIDKRNEVLAEIGTANFERAVKNAVEAQTREKYEDEWRSFLCKKGLKEIPYDDTFSGKYRSCQNSYCMLGTVAAEEYKLCGDEQYFSFNYRTVYFRRDTNDEDNKKWAEKEKAEAIAREKKARLDEATERAFSLRHDFIFGMSEAEAKKNIGSIIEFDIRRDWETAAQGGYYMRYIHEKFTERQLGTRDGYHTISNEVQNSPYRSFLRHVYVRWSDDEKLGFADWNAKWENNERLALIYDFLMKIGYDMSDEEKELRDGTSALFDGRNEFPELNADDHECDGDCETCERREECNSTQAEDDTDISTDDEIIAALKEKYGDDDE